MAVDSTLNFERPIGSGDEIPWVLIDGGGSTYEAHKLILSHIYPSSGHKIHGPDGDDQDFIDLHQLIHGVDLVFTEV